LFDPVVGDVMFLLIQRSVHRFDGRNLTAYEGTKIVLPPQREDALLLWEWWELSLLEKEDCFDDDNGQRRVLTTGRRRYQ
jgi:hypothetical protein